MPGMMIQDEHFIIFQRYEHINLLHAAVVWRVLGCCVGTNAKVLIADTHTGYGITILECYNVSY